MVQPERHVITDIFLKELSDKIDKLSPTIEMHVSYLSQDIKNVGVRLDKLENKIDNHDMWHKTISYNITKFSVKALGILSLFAVVFVIYRIDKTSLYEFLEVVSKIR